VALYMHYESLNNVGVIILVSSAQIILLDDMHLLISAHAWKTNEPVYESKVKVSVKWDNSNPLENSSKLSSLKPLSKVEYDYVLVV